jgi:hypothetical protein
MKKRILLITFYLAILAGCNGTDGSKVELKEQVGTLKIRLTELEEKIDELNSDIFLLKANQQQFQIANFDPAITKKYERIDTTSGTFLVYLQDVSPHLDGVKIVLKIGNIQYASYKDVKLKVNYSKRYPKYDKNESLEDRKNKLELFTKSKRVKEEVFITTIKPSTWNSVPVFLPDIKTTDFGSFDLSMTTDIVSLNTN